MTCNYEKLIKIGITCAFKIFFNINCNEKNEIIMEKDN